jgi:hypothetical protein
MDRLEIERASGIDGRYVSRDGTVEGACPGCGSNPFRIATHPAEDFGHGCLRAGARCRACNDPVGWFYTQAKAPTIFGEEEDRNILQYGRARVYGMQEPRG